MADPNRALGPPADILAPASPYPKSFSPLRPQAPEVLLCPAAFTPENKNMEWLWYNDKVRFCPIKADTSPAMLLAAPVERSQDDIPGT